jgi:hypothetical protein
VKDQLSAVSHKSKMAVSTGIWIDRFGNTLKSYVVSFTTGPFTLRVSLVSIKVWIYLAAVPLAKLDSIVFFVHCVLSIKPQTTIPMMLKKCAVTCRSCFELHSFFSIGTQGGQKRSCAFLCMA